MKTNQLIITVVVVVIVGLGAFFAGLQYQKSQSQILASQAGNGGQGGRQGGFGRRLGGANGQAVRGQIISVDTNSMTIKMNDGSSKIVILSGNTAITKSATVPKTDLTTGAQVMVFGSNNSDGSVTAQFVQLNPMMMRPSGQAQTSGSPKPSTSY